MTPPHEKQREFRKLDLRHAAVTPEDDETIAIRAMQARSLTGAHLELPDLKARCAHPFL